MPIAVVMDLVHNPPSLKLLSVCCIRKLISCMGQDVERDLIEKLSSGDLHDLSNSNGPVSLGEMCKYLNVFLSLLRLT